MLVENQLVEIKIWGKSVQHYKKLGYDVKQGDVINVPPQHLMESSGVHVQVVCDLCGKTISKSYAQLKTDCNYDEIQLSDRKEPRIENKEVAI